jgi:hypothetical protein
MIKLIKDSLKDIEQHLDNINELLPGIPDDISEDFLMQVQTASVSLEEAHSYLIGEHSIPRIYLTDLNGGLSARRERLETST